MLKNKRALSLLLIFFVFLILRLYRLGWHDLWYDEIATVNYARDPWYNWNAPLYWILLHFWIKLFGISGFSLRFPSLIFSFFSLILVFLLGRELFNKRVGLTAAILMGLSPFHLWYAQEARDYAMVLCLGLLSSWFFYRALKEGKLKLWLFFTLSSIAGFYTNYFYIFLFLAQILYLVFARKTRLSLKETIPFVAIVFAFSFFLPRFLRKFYYIWQGFWIPPPEWKSLVITLENFMLGYNGSLVLYLISDILVVAFSISALWVIYKKRELRQGAVFCTALFIIPVISAFVFSKIFFSVYLDRGLIIFSPYLYLILSLGIVFLNKALRAVSLSVLILLLLLADCRYFKGLMVEPLAHHIGTYLKKPVKPIANFLENNVKPQDIVAYTNDSIIPSLSFYSRRTLGSFYYLFDPAILESSWQRPVQEGWYNIPFNKIRRLRFKQLWVIACDWPRSGELDENSQSVKNFLDNNLRLKDSYEFGGLWIFRYVKKDS